MPKKPTLLLLLLLLAACSSTSDTRIKPQGLTCFFFLIPECPASLNNIPKVKALADDYGPKGVEFVGVISEPEFGDSAFSAFTTEHAFNFPVKLDDSLHLAQAHGAHTTPQVMLYQHDLLMYSGGVDDYYFSLSKHRNRVEEEYLRDALEDCLAQRPVRTPSTSPVGCVINFQYFDEIPECH